MTDDQRDKLVVCDTAKVRFFKQITTGLKICLIVIELFAILQKYDFSSKSQPLLCLLVALGVVCDTAKVRFFKQITTVGYSSPCRYVLFAILQKYDFSSKSQLVWILSAISYVVCDTAKVRFFKQITTFADIFFQFSMLFAILQKYDFSSKSQPQFGQILAYNCCLRYCKSTIFQANHNSSSISEFTKALFAILQKYDFSSKSQRFLEEVSVCLCCLRYCKSTIFQANHNSMEQR